MTDNSTAHTCPAHPQRTSDKSSGLCWAGQWLLLTRPSQRRQGDPAGTTAWSGALVIYHGSEATAKQASEVRGPSCKAYLLSGCLHPGAWTGGIPLGAVYPFLNIFFFKMCDYLLLKSKIHGVKNQIVLQGFYKTAVTPNLSSAPLPAS